MRKAGWECTKHLVESSGIKLNVRGAEGEREDIEVALVQKINMTVYLEGDTNGFLLYSPHPF